ncbi:hypothetical protein ACP4OV_017327 [Aristida adscensionis]
MASPAGFWRIIRSWSTKQWVVAALLGQLVAIVVVASISITLAPAHIAFSIKDATTNSTSYLSGTRFNFTVVANNTAGHTAVSYRQLSVEIVRYNPSRVWTPAEANMTEVQGKWQKPGPQSGIPFQILANAGQYSRPEKGKDSKVTVKPVITAAFPRVDDNFTVVVEAKVVFKYGLATKPYTVRASCWPVHFFSGTHLQPCH